ncbi:MAG: DUF3426 domain-containing protein [Gammaproteobacteria bacterium]|nr:DUF3426 domain-containing protein [Gammaproteobacteria bacterium]
MTNTTQCPNCFSNFEITDDLYLKSTGKVRCGVCQRTFEYAEPLHASFTSPWAEPADDDHNIPANFDSESPEEIAGLLRDAVLGNHPREDSLNEFLDTRSIQSYSDNIEDNIHSELSIDMADDDPLTSVDASEDSASHSKSSEFTQTELDLPGIDAGEEITALAAQQAATTAAVEDHELIAEVDQLVDDKLLTPEQHSHPESTGEDEPPLIINKPPQSAVSRWLWTPLLALVVVLLLAAAIYQLWLRQALPVLESKAISGWTVPLGEGIATTLGVAQPVRRDLASLQLVSARTEAHPTRPSTILLRVSVMNRSKIPQPFPWLEISLTDKDGRLVSRRALSPEDYLYNNRLENKINANELQAITIELLAFPKQATGYELILLNK